MSSNKPTEILASLATLLPELEAVYKEIVGPENSGRL